MGSKKIAGTDSEEISHALLEKSKTPKQNILTEMIEEGGRGVVIELCDIFKTCLKGCFQNIYYMRVLTTYRV